MSRKKLETIVIYIAVLLGTAGAPPDTYGVLLSFDCDDLEFPAQERRDQCAYWALSIGPSGRFPPFLVHVWFEGEMPDETRRDAMNYQIQEMIGRFVLKLPPKCAKCGGLNVDKFFPIDYHTYKVGDKVEVHYVCQQCGWNEQVYEFKQAVN